MDLTPIFRIEYFLDAIVNSTTPELEPLFRIEKFLARIAGVDVETPEPLYRVEKYLAKIAGDSIEIPEPLFRIEYYLASLCGMDVIVPEPIYRVEYWLAEWAGGGDLPWTEFTGNPLEFDAQKAHALQSCLVAIEPIQSGSGDPSPDNVRPISGSTGATVTRTGKNLLNDVNPVVLNAYFNGGTVTANNSNRIVVIPCSPSTTYTFTWNRVAISGTQNARVCTFTSLPTIGSAGSIKVANVIESTSESFTTGASDTYIGIHMGSTSTTDFSASLSASMLNLGSTAEPYEAYSGASVTISFGQTVYGGTDEIVSGTGTSEWGKFTLDGNIADADFDITVLDDFTQIAYVPFVAVGKGDGSFMSNVFAFVRPSYRGEYKIWNNESVATPRMFIGLPKTVTTKAEAKAWFADNPTDIIFQLATPTSFTTTPTEVTAVKDRNVMWTDASNLTVEARGTAVNLNSLQSLNILLGNRYVNNHTADDVDDDEALQILLGGQR